LRKKRKKSSCRKSRTGSTQLSLSGYKGMWLFALFDLPVVSKKDRKNYADFRKALLKRGFTMLQYSVYVRYCACEENGRVLMKGIENEIPPAGQIRLLLVTDHQFGKMQVFSNAKIKETEKPPEQLMLF